MNHEDKRKKNVQPKKVYIGPRIFDYGTIEKMTKNVGKTSNTSDNSGMGASVKTR